MIIPNVVNQQSGRDNVVTTVAAAGGGASGDRSLLDLTGHIEGQFLITPNELVVVIVGTNRIIIGVAAVMGFVTNDSTEPIHMELPLKGLVLRLIEEQWHDGCGKDCRLVHPEGLPLGMPRYDVIQSSPRHVFEHLM